MGKRTILWIEDRSETVFDQRRYCEENGLEVKLVSTSHDFMDFLEEKKEEIGLIIVDIMLYSVKNLKDIGIENSDTDGGYNAGWVIINRVLRPKNEKDSPYANIPLLVISSRPLTKKDSEGLDHLEYIEKGGLSRDGRRAWSEEFKQIVKKYFQN